MTAYLDIPVIMYHTVGVVEPSWRWRFLTVPWPIFEDQLRFLRDRDYSAITLSQLYAYRKEQAPLPLRPVIFTFDDGYLDNWVYAAPLLKKYGFCGTVFVNPEFVDPSPACRPTLDDLVAGRCSQDQMPGMGFLCWAELKEMERTGVMEIHSHAMSHTWYACGPQIKDFRHPGDDYVWMDWNNAPERKWEYLSGSYRPPARWGEPVYEHCKSLQGRRFFPDPALGSHLQGVAVREGSEFFQRPDWRTVLLAEVERYRSEHRLAERFESNAEFRARLDWELGESQRIIGERLGKKVPFLCWPGGGYSAEATELAHRYYQASNLASSDRTPWGLGADGHLTIRRFGTPYVERKGVIAYQGGRYLHHLIRELQGNTAHRFARKALKALALAQPDFAPT